MSMQQQQQRPRLDDGQGSVASGGSFNLRHLLPRQIRECMGDEEHDKQGKMLLVPTTDTTHEGAVIDSDSNMNTVVAPDSSDRRRRSKRPTQKEPGAAGTNGDGPPPAEDVPNVVDSYTDSSILSDTFGSDFDFDTSNEKAHSFLTFRLSYLFVTLVVMLADGLQGTLNCCTRKHDVQLLCAWNWIRVFIFGC